MPDEHLVVLVGDMVTEVGGTRGTPPHSLNACLKSFCRLAPDEDDLKVVEDVTSTGTLCA